MRFDEQGWSHYIIADRSCFFTIPDDEMVLRIPPAKLADIRVRHCQTNHQCLDHPRRQFNLFDYLFGLFATELLGMQLLLGYDFARRLRGDICELSPAGIAEKALQEKEPDTLDSRKLLRPGIKDKPTVLFPANGTAHFGVTGGQAGADPGLLAQSALAAEFWLLSSLPLQKQEDREACDHSHRDSLHGKHLQFFHLR